MAQIGLRLATLFIPSVPPFLQPRSALIINVVIVISEETREGRKRRSVRASVPPLFSAGGIKSEHPRTQRTLHHDKTIGLRGCNDAGLLHRPPPSRSLKKCGWTDLSDGEKVPSLTLRPPAPATAMFFLRP